MVGHSYGGVVALEAAVQRPDLVASLGVFEPTVPFTDWWPDHDEMMQRSLDLKPMFKRWNDGMPRRTPEQRAADEISMARDFSFVETAPFDFADVAVPCLVGGSVDTTPWDFQSADRLSTLLDADVVVFRDAGHTVHRTHAREFADFTRRAVALAALTSLRRTYFGGNRTAPSMRMTSPLSMVLVQMCSTSAPYSSGLPMRFGNGFSSSRRLHPVLRHHPVGGRRERARRDGHHAHADGREVASRGQRHADDAALRRRVRGLADHALEGRDRRGHDHHAALVVLERFFLAHLRGGDAHHVERADEERLDRDREALVGGRGAVAADDATAASGATAAVHRHAQRPVARRDPDDLFDLFVVLDVAAHELGLAAELLDHPPTTLVVDVGDDDVGAGRVQTAGGGLTQSRGAAGDDCSHSVEFHGVCLPHCDGGGEIRPGAICGVGRDGERWSQPALPRRDSRGKR